MVTGNCIVTRKRLPSFRCAFLCSLCGSCPIPLSRVCLAFCSFSPCSPPWFLLLLLVFPPSFRFVLFHDLSFFFVFPFPPPPCSRASIYTCVHVCVWWYVSECADVFCSLVLCYRTCLVLSCFSTGPEHHIISKHGA